LPIPGEPSPPGRYKRPHRNSRATLIPWVKKVWGYEGGRLTKDKPVGPDDSTPIHALLGLAEDDLASGASIASGCLVVSGALNIEQAGVGRVGVENLRTVPGTAATTARAVRFFPRSPPWSRHVTLFLNAPHNGLLSPHSGVISYG